ncbi:hypothetical protein M427DRAFT_151083 [Gonapodya prolifera JEL478]|uniref:Uncharacterized protein n=1 Tax=Gonapodya prolifera (strain JEL478) TaxID=1344416 RepID=A0A139AYI9_GONPJ|nr:hypothetical protein M427DRAFT_151083 [Gonapodya prolifera JEL478]|eukprot:KXS21811.1 hypothetical protein M427DRAFT_151083 [Gonapodya prolifera JEL478]
MSDRHWSPFGNGHGLASNPAVVEVNAPVSPISRFSSRGKKVQEGNRHLGAVPPSFTPGPGASVQHVEHGANGRLGRQDSVFGGLVRSISPIRQPSSPLFQPRTASASHKRKQSLLSPPQSPQTAASPPLLSLSSPFLVPSLSLSSDGDSNRASRPTSPDGPGAYRRSRSALPVHSRTHSSVSIAGTLHNLLAPTPLVSSAPNSTLPSLTTTNAERYAAAPSPRRQASPHRQASHSKRWTTDELLEQGCRFLQPSSLSHRDALARFQSAERSASVGQDMYREARAIVNQAAALRAPQTSITEERPPTQHERDSLAEKKLRQAWALVRVMLSQVRLRGTSHRNSWYDLCSDFVEEAERTLANVRVAQVRAAAGQPPPPPPKDDFPSTTPGSPPPANLPSNKLFKRRRAGNWSLKMVEGRSGIRHPDPVCGPPMVALILDITNNLGNVCFALGRIRVASAWWESSLEMTDRVLRQFPLPMPCPPLSPTESQLHQHSSRPNPFKLHYIHRITLNARVRSLTHLGVLLSHLEKHETALRAHTHAMELLDLWSSFLEPRETPRPTSSASEARSLDERGLPKRVASSWGGSLSSRRVSDESGGGGRVNSWVVSDGGMETITRMRAVVSAHIGTSLEGLGRLGAAITSRRRAVEGFKAIGDNIAATREKGNLGALLVWWAELAAKALSNADTAEGPLPVLTLKVAQSGFGYMMDALFVYSRIGDQTGVVVVSSALGNACRALDGATLSLDFYQRIVDSRWKPLTQSRTFPGESPIPSQTVPSPLNKEDLVSGLWTNLLAANMLIAVTQIHAGKERKETNEQCQNANLVLSLFPFDPQLTTAVDILLEHIQLPSRTMPDTFTAGCEALMRLLQTRSQGSAISSYELNELSAKLEKRVAIAFYKKLNGNGNDSRVGSLWMMSDAIPSSVFLIAQASFAFSIKARTLGSEYNEIADAWLRYGVEKFDVVLGQTLQYLENSQENGGSVGRTTTERLELICRRWMERGSADLGLVWSATMVASILITASLVLSLLPPTGSEGTKASSLERCMPIPDYQRVLFSAAAQMVAVNSLGSCRRCLEDLAITLLAPEEEAETAMKPKDQLRTSFVPPHWRVKVESRLVSCPHRVAFLEQC